MTSFLNFCCSWWGFRFHKPGLSEMSGHLKNKDSTLLFWFGGRPLPWPSKAWKYQLGTPTVKRTGTRETGMKRSATKNPRGWCACESTLQGTNGSVEGVEGFLTCCANKNYGSLPETNTSHLKIHPWKRRFLLETIIFGCYVSLGKEDDRFLLGPGLLSGALAVGGG